MALVDHVLPGRDGGSELPVGRGDTWLLIKVDLPRQRFPANPRDLVVFEEESSADCHPPGELKRRAVKDEQVHPRGSSTSKEFGGGRRSTPRCLHQHWRGSGQ